ncbi:small ribosomal subunit protein eS21-like [Cavia porcellus]|uniref:small ribosomal subunit protein eS21-like n=1 Tax=Cavia porcellus TaxID=10141 RepID=UPI002FE29B50
MEALHVSALPLYAYICNLPSSQATEGSISGFNTQNEASKFMDMYVSQKCSTSTCIIGAKDHTSIKMNMAEVDKVTGKFIGQFKTYAIFRAIRRMGESNDSILRLAKADGIVSKNF